MSPRQNLHPTPKKSILHINQIESDKSELISAIHIVDMQLKIMKNN